MDTPPMQPAGLPIRRSLTLTYALSILVTILMAALSLAGLLYQTASYPTEELQRTFVSNDVGNLGIGVPILLVSMWLARRGSASPLSLRDAPAIRRGGEAIALLLTGSPRLR
ncbi:MAG: hypothetical protein JSU61_06540 [Fidelibacterota bacterium]|nr:MAG: hypothetical protein JSU61_06540 [Candidatus Neomarinimicrobiota bacterium]